MREGRHQERGREGEGGQEGGERGGRKGRVSKEEGKRRDGSLHYFVFDFPKPPCVEGRVGQPHYSHWKSEDTKSCVLCRALGAGDPQWMRQTGSCFCEIHSLVEETDTKQVIMLITHGSASQAV